jgi:hypothetical protein
VDAAARRVPAVLARSTPGLRLVFVLDATALDERATVLYLGLLVQIQHGRP